MVRTTPYQTHRCQNIQNIPTIPHIPDTPNTPGHLTEARWRLRSRLLSEKYHQTVRLRSMRGLRPRLNAAAYREAMGYAKSPMSPGESASPISVVSGERVEPMAVRLILLIYLSTQQNPISAIILVGSDALLQFVATTFPLAERYLSRSNISTVSTLVRLAR